MNIKKGLDRIALVVSALLVIPMFFIGFWVAQDLFTEPAPRTIKEQVLENLFNDEQEASDAPWE